MKIYRCPGCNDIVLMVMAGDEVDQAELATKQLNHAKQHEALEDMMSGSIDE